MSFVKYVDGVGTKARPRLFVPDMSGHAKQSNFRHPLVGIPFVIILRSMASSTRRRFKGQSNAQVSNCGRSQRWR